MAVLTLETLLERAAISDVVNAYATGVDTRDWALYRSVFADEIAIDFTSWSGEEKYFFCSRSRSCGH